MRELVLTFLMILLFPVLVFPADWRYVGFSSPEEDAFYVDMDSVDRGDGDKVFCSTKNVLKVPKQYHFGKSTVQKYEWEMNCSDKTFKITMFDALGEDGESVYFKGYPEARFEPVPPGSYVDTLYQMVCH
ncbi:MAG: hypothetical protein HY582_03400 [Candidatus Omnitrophica bacterium]|nr:hypothetical protein [Candidatus Omnitrophota bacterium]